MKGILSSPSGRVSRDLEVQQKEVQLKVDFTKVKSMSKETGLKLLGELGFVQRVVVSNELT